MPASCYPTGTTIYVRDKAYDSLILFDGRNNNSFLIDMNGSVVHSWEYSGFPVKMINPVLNNGKKGDIICQQGSDVYVCEKLIIVDWQGKIVREWGSENASGVAQQNHGLKVLPNGNLLILAFCDSSFAELRARNIKDQVIYEVDKSGKIVWQWLSSEHIEELGFTGQKRDLLFSEKSRNRSSLFVINNINTIGENIWWDKGDERFNPDNIIFDSREGSFTAIIDKKTSKIVWEIGPDLSGSYDYSKQSFTGKIPRKLDMLCGQHNSQIIPRNLQGEGNLLIFDNQGAAGFPPIHQNMFPGSRVMEINPITLEIVWQYDASKNGLPLWHFYSSFVSTVKRLPNGNTLICEGMYGRIFQVTFEGEIVWEYINPHFGQWTDHDVDSGGSKSNYIFNAQVVPHDWVPQN